MKNANTVLVISSCISKAQPLVGTARESVHATGGGGGGGSGADHHIG
jgi:hypothetical protein